MISVCCPTRGRPDFAVRLYESIINTAKNKVELVLAVDEDDPLLSEYKVKCPEAKFVIGDRHVLGTLYNRMWKQSSGEILMLTGDDMYFITKNWDLEVEKIVHSYPDKICFITGNIGLGNGHFIGPLYLFVTKRVCDILGYFCPPWLNRWVDIWVADVGEKVGRLFRAEISIDHVHPTMGKREYDQTIMELDRTLGTDHQIFSITEHVRNNDANVLKKHLKRGHVILM